MVKVALRILRIFKGAFTLNKNDKELR